MIRGKVAKILNEFQLVLNIGASEGVASGMQFIIYQEGEEILDPESGNSLGNLELVKGKIEIYHIQESLSLAQSKRLEDNQSEASTVLSARLAEVTPSARKKLESEHIRLNIKQSEISGLSATGPIKVGDLVRSIEI